MNAVRRKRPEKQTTISGFLLHYNAPAHRSVFVKDFLTKNKVTALQHPPYSLDLTPASFYYLSPRLKSGMQGRRFCYSTDVIKNATEELKML
jgi:hypothetical protein